MAVSRGLSEVEEWDSQISEARAFPAEEAAHAKAQRQNQSLRLRESEATHAPGTPGGSGERLEMMSERRMVSRPWGTWLARRQFWILFSEGEKPLEGVTYSHFQRIHLVAMENWEGREWWQLGSKQEAFGKGSKRVATLTRSQVWAGDADAEKCSDIWTWELFPFELLHGFSGSFGLLVSSENRDYPLGDKKSFV